MKPVKQDQLEKELSDMASRLQYPATPDISARIQTRLADGRSQRLVPSLRLALALLLLLALLAISVPAVRARLAGFFQIGVVRIVPLTAAPTFENNSTPAPTSSLDSLLNLAGETTLAQAHKITGFPILLPTYPSDLGSPERVYFQSRAKMLILVWLDPADHQKVRLSLYEFGPDTFVMKKIDANILQETSVTGHYAVWTSGPYFVEVKGNDFQSIQLVDGHVLIWMVDSLTYRLETDLALNEAIKIGESLR
jgi:hypothetical protein